MKQMTMVLSKDADKTALGQRYGERKREILDDDLIAILENPLLDEEEMYRLVTDLWMPCTRTLSGSPA